jgi:hypothetical protein
MKYTLFCLEVALLVTFFVSLPTKSTALAHPLDGAHLLRPRMIMPTFLTVPGPKEKLRQVRNDIMRTQNARPLYVSSESSAMKSSNRNWGVTSEYKGDKATRDYMNKQAKKIQREKKLKKTMSKGKGKACMGVCLKPLAESSDSEPERVVVRGLAA